jgi:hypothetical protein
MILLHRFQCRMPLTSLTFHPPQYQCDADDYRPERDKESDGDSCADRVLADQVGSEEAFAELGETHICPVDVGDDVSEEHQGITRRITWWITVCSSSSDSFDSLGTSWT